MIRLLKWLGVIALIVTIVVYAIYGDSISAMEYIALFIGVASTGWLSSLFFARKAFMQVVWLFELIVFFTYELVKASFVIAYEVLTPTHYMQAGIIAVPLDIKSNLGITIFSSLVTLTPGTLSVDVSVDKSHLFVHAMYLNKVNTAAFSDELKEGFERRIIRILE